ncbi:YdiU family protein [Rhodobacteraceae bacterium 2CG4]|uniref:Protein nucleotidyltransferase YdiU n=1 Tax=Halovulum marinum TaxID=2662447 RepID=A0A6L5Z4M9_9RHOB|nr:YdiU family protein [Halovulum marinum]MSU91516.1 YdiU family protein [Halovulum marinum]
MNLHTRIPFDNSYARLPGRFYARLDPTPVAEPGLIRVNHALARQLGLDPAALETPAGVAMLAGNGVPDGAEPLAMAYAGHQFGGWVPQLGDGRAILLGEVVDSAGVRRDIQLKGAGRTPFSRMGDGRAWLGPVLREYLVSEAMAALAIPTTRALAAVSTGERVQREAAFPGAVLARVAASHIRVGTFQYFAARQDLDALRRLSDHVIARHYPALAPGDHAGLLRAVVGAQARLVARWMGVGFIHGVMNTDNMSVAGETIDYGPCAFLDAYHPDTVFSSIDQMGRYAYRNQPAAAQWNLAQFASSLLPIMADDPEAAVPEAQAAVDAFQDQYQQAWAEVFRAKLGLAEPQDGDTGLATALLDAMAATRADFTGTFRALAETAADAPLPEHIASDTAPLEDWRRRWVARLAAEAATPADRQRGMARANPAIIPRNHRVEQAIQAALGGDFGPFHALTQALEQPFDAPADSPFRAAPAQGEEVRQTFCGT